MKATIFGIFSFGTGWVAFGLLQGCMYRALNITFNCGSPGPLFLFLRVARALSFCFARTLRMEMPGQRSSILVDFSPWASYVSLWNDELKVENCKEGDGNFKTVLQPSKHMSNDVFSETLWLGGQLPPSSVTRQNTRAHMQHLSMMPVLCMDPNKSSFLTFNRHAQGQPTARTVTSGIYPYIDVRIPVSLFPSVFQ